MNKKRLVSILTLVVILVSLVTVAFATGEAAPVAAEGVAVEATAEGAAAEGEVYWYHSVLAALSNPIVMLILMFVLFYFVLIRPENKRKKEAADMRNNIKVGDEITTIGGIVGRVSKVKDDEITIETGADQNTIRLAKWAISTVSKK